MSSLSAVRTASPWPEDLQLARRVAEGDAHAKRLLAHRLVDRVRRQARLLLGSAGAEADDASQQALVGVLEAIRSYRGDASLEWWASRVAARAIVRHARRARVEAARRADDAADVMNGPAFDGLAPDVRRFLALLSRVQAEALVLKNAYGFTVDEMAVTLDVPTGTVKDRLVTARARLRELIDAEQRRVDDPGRGGGR